MLAQGYLSAAPLALLLSRSLALQSNPSLAPSRSLPTQDRVAVWEMAPVYSRSCPEHTREVNPSGGTCGSRGPYLSWLVSSVEEAAGQTGVESCKWHSQDPHHPRTAPSAQESAFP